MKVTHEAASDFGVEILQTCHLSSCQRAVLRQRARSGGCVVCLFGDDVCSRFQLSELWFVGL